MSVPLICLFSFLTGMGSCSAFSASIKTCTYLKLAKTAVAYPYVAALNWPNHRGTATAFPLSAFGLSAFFFSTISSFAFPDNTSDFLLLLAAGTFSMTFISSFFLRVIPHTSSYSAVSTDEARGRSDSNSLYRTKSGESRYGAECLSQEPGRPSAVPTTPDSNQHHYKVSKDRTMYHESPEVPNADTDENSSLMSKSSASDLGDVDYREDGAECVAAHDSHCLDIRGMALLPKVEFWQLFAMLGLLTGIGLMTIK